MGAAAAARHRARTLQAVFGEWRELAAETHAPLRRDEEAVCAAARQQLARNVRRRALCAWRDHAAARRDLRARESYLRDTWRRERLQRLLRGWRDAAGTSAARREVVRGVCVRRCAEGAAEVARAALGAWSAWTAHERALRTAAARHVRRKQHERAACVLGAWADCAARARANEASLARHLEARRLRTLRACVERWRDEARANARLQQLGRAAVAARDRRVRARCLGAWRLLASDAATATAAQEASSLASRLAQTEAERDAARSASQAATTRAAEAEATAVLGAALAPSASLLGTSLRWRRLRAEGEEPTARERLTCAWLPLKPGTEGDGAAAAPALRSESVSGGCTVVREWRRRAMGHAVLFGGMTQQTWLTDVWLLRWQPVATVEVTTVDSGAAPAVGPADGPVRASVDLTLAGGALDADAPGGEWVWRRAAVHGEAPVARRDHASCAVGADTVLVVGGFDGTRERNDSFLLHIAEHADGASEPTATWEEVPMQGIAGRAGHGVCFDVRSGVAVMFGGYCSRGGAVHGPDGVHGHLNDTAVYTPAHRRWWRPDIRGDPPPHRRGHAMAAGNGRVFLHGGFNGREHLSDMHVLDTESWQWSRVDPRGPSPPPRRQHALVLVGRHVLLYGGYDGQSYLNDVWAFDTRHGMWRPLDVEAPPSECPQPRAAHAAALVGRRILVAGGIGSSGSVPGCHVIESDAVEAGAQLTARAVATAAEAQQIKERLINAVGEQRGTREKARALEKDAERSKKMHERAVQSGGEAIKAARILRQKLADERAEAARLRAAAEAATRRAEKLRRRLAAAYNGVGELNAAAAEALGQLAHLQAQADHWRRAAEALQADTEAARAAEALSTQRCSDLTLRLSHAEQACEEARASLEALPGVVQSVRDEMQAHHDREFGAAREAWRAGTRRLQSQISAAEAELAAEQQRARELAAEADALRATAAQARAEAIEARARAAASGAPAEAEVRRQTARAAQLERELAAAEEGVRDARRAAAAADDRAAAARERITELRAELAAAEGRRGELEEAYARLEAEKRAAEALRTEATKRAAEMRGALTADIERLEVALARERARLADLATSRAATAAAGDAMAGGGRAGSPPGTPSSGRVRRAAERLQREVRATGADAPGSDSDDNVSALDDPPTQSSLESEREPGGDASGAEESGIALDTSGPDDWSRELEEMGLGRRGGTEVGRLRELERELLGLDAGASTDGGDAG
ncbi:unnamed protein product [Pedinophyceae sp. YPF-701]|nr:unnamed protein product [Pedinophyceae sp. YPF-701]